MFSKRLSALASSVEVILPSTLLAIMIALVFADVVLRYIFSAPITGASEIATTLLVWVTFLGSAVALRRHLHVAITVVIDRVPPRARAVIQLLSNLALVASLIVVAFYGLDLIRASGSRELPLTQIPLSAVYAAVPTGCLLMVSALLVDVWRLRDPSPSTPAPSTESGRGGFE